MKAVFFDASPTMLAKNLLPIAEYFKTKDNDFEAIFVSAEISSNVDVQVEQESILKIIKKNDFKLIKIKTFSKNKIRKFLMNESPDFLFIAGYRIFDRLWIGISKLLGIPTFTLQHGFEIDYVFYKPIAILSKFRKGVRLSIAIFNLAKVINIEFINLYYDYVRYIFHGKLVKESRLNHKLLHPFISFVYSEYYKEFWENKFGFNKSQMIIITPSDFLLLNHIRGKTRQKGCCYITQTLVEDGRMKEKEFLRLMESYKEVARSVEKFIIKLHPRSKVEYYDIFRELDNVIITRDFPNCQHYLTHYSSMAFTASFLSDSVILHELKGHPTPKILKSIVSNIVYDTKDIIPILNNGDNGCPNIEQQKKKLNYYAVMDDVNPYERIYSEIKKIL